LASILVRGSFITALLIAPATARAADEELAAPIAAPAAPVDRHEDGKESSFTDIWGLDVGVFTQGFRHAPALAPDGSLHDRRETSIPLTLFGVAADPYAAKLSGDRWQLRVGAFPARFA